MVKLEYELPDDIISGELIYIHGIHNPTRYAWGWGITVDGPFESLIQDELVRVCTVLFRGKLVLLRYEEFTRFAWYNKHLIHENDSTTPEKMVP